MYDPSYSSPLRRFFFYYASTSKFQKWLLASLFAICASIFAIASTLLFFSLGLPDYRQLIDYDPSKTTRVYANDGKLISEFAVEKRVFVPIDELPQSIIEAFIAAEDKNFYAHFGLDIKGIMRAIGTNMANIISGSNRLVGASTITQQVAKNFLLSQEKTITRKIREAILAIRIEKSLDKNRILELYLNEIYLGRQSYGVASAARRYFGLDVRELKLEQVAYIAALPKAPNRYNPQKNYEAAIGRRNWVLSRMLANNFIQQQQYDDAIAKKLVILDAEQRIKAKGSFFAEEVRRELLGAFGEKELYHGGMTVYSTLEPRLQIFAEQALQNGIRQYDRRHGYRGHIGSIKRNQNSNAVVEMKGKYAQENNERKEFKELSKPKGSPKHWRLARVKKIDAKYAAIVTQDGTNGKISLDEMKWARAQIKPSLQQIAKKQNNEELVLRAGRYEIENQQNAQEKLGERIKKTTDLLEVGDVLLVARKKGEEYTLEQVPEVNGALVAMDPFSGAVLAMVGGWNFNDSEFNRGTQAMRQPGSAFKPFVYLAALENNFTPATRILDAPFVLHSDSGEPKWKPSNFSQKFYGPSPMRLGIEHSRNLMTVRLAQAIGMDKVADTTRRFGIIENMPQQLALALGSGETTLTKMVAGYSMFANGGYKITPSLIERVQKDSGETIYRRYKQSCNACNVSDSELAADAPLPLIPQLGERVTDSVSAYQIVSMLQGVIDRGTGQRVRSEVVGDIAGKTGTTNNNQDAWFVGFSPKIAAGVYIGFDQPKSLGRLPSGTQETGSSAAAPIFAKFMREALRGVNSGYFLPPRGIEIVAIDRNTGGRVQGEAKHQARGGEGAKIFNEVFKIGNAPKTSKESLLITGGAVSRDNSARGSEENSDGESGGSQGDEVPALGIY